MTDPRHIRSPTRFVHVPGADGEHPTYCRICEAQCGMVATVEDGRITKVSPDREHPVSSGHMCIKGPGMTEITNDPDRVLTPLRRVGAPGSFEPVDWDVALTDICARLQAVLDAHGGSAVGMYQGNPTAFATLHGGYAGRFLRALGGSKMFTVVHCDTGSKNVAMELIFGTTGSFTFPDLERCDFLLVLGANPAVSHMSIVSEPRALQKLKSIHGRGGVVIVDPRRTESAKKFEHVPIKPDGDAWMLGAMLHEIFAEGLEARDYLDAHAHDWRQLRAAVEPLTPERASGICGVPVERIRELARRMATARTAACYGRVGVNRGRFSTLVNIFIESLNVVTGRFGARGGWVTGVPPIAAMPGGPPPPAYGTVRSRIGDIPMVGGRALGGSLADEIRLAGDGQLRALFVDSGNPVHSYPNGDATAAALEQLELCVAMDFYVTETSRHADYILPATTFFERPDLTDFWVANAPRPWVQYVDAVIEPCGQARHEYDIFDDILRGMGRPGLFATEERPRPELMEVADDLLRAGPYGLSIQQLRDEFPSGLQVRDAVDAEGSWARVRTPDGKARLFCDVTAGEIDRLISESKAAPDGTLKLFGRRKLGSMNTWMHNVQRLVRSDLPLLLMHPDDAGARGLLSGQTVEVSSRSGSVRVELQVTDDVLSGSVCYPHGWGHRGGWSHASNLPGANFNDLTSSRPEDWEQVSGMVHVDGVPVTVSPAV